MNNYNLAEKEKYHPQLISRIRKIFKPLNNSNMKKIKEEITNTEGSKRSGIRGEIIY